MSFAATLLFSILGFFGLARSIEYRIAISAIPVLEMGMALISATFLGLSLFSRPFRENIYQYLIVLVYTVSLAAVFRLYASGFHGDLALASLIFTLLGCLFFFDHINLLAYQLFVAVIILLAALITSEPLTDMGLFAFRFILLHTVAYLIISFRIRISRDLREKDMRFRQLFEGLNDGVIYVDKFHRINLVNASTAQISGYAKEDIIGKPVDILFPEWQQWVEREEKNSAALPARMDAHLICKDGARIWVSCSLAAISDEFDRPDGYVAALINITESRKAQTELRRTAEKLAQTNKELEQFSYFASHDLKAPLGTIRHFAQHLIGQADTGAAFTAQDKEAVSIILEDAQRMSKLIDALLLYSSSGASTIEKVELSMDEVLKDALDNLAGYIEESGATVHSEKLPVLSGDRVQLTRLMQNLIGNAILYRKEEPLVVNISVSINESASAHVFSVHDNGVGIDSRDYQRVFQMFQQAGPNDKAGLGIGLAICKRIIENHNGAIWLKSIKGKGTTIFFSLPM